MINGDLKRRLDLNKRRLLDDLYSYPTVFNQGSSWPGDFEGRALLALTNLYFAYSEEKNTQKEIFSHINEIVNHLEEYTNEDLYFGPLFNSDCINEQALAGNSWYIRGLANYYSITNDQQIYEKIINIQNKFLIPLCNCFDSYPITSRTEEGAVGGYLLEDSSGKWILSSDVGCAFIMLDGLVTVFELTGDENLKNGIIKAISSFNNIDYVNLKAQTHATLTCNRAILRFYKITHIDKYLDTVIRNFDIYQKFGMTFEYENINWFLRPDTWTEPCCVIDSWILAKDLYLITRNAKYLAFYNRVITNGLRTFQRENGGAGCSTIVNSSSNVMRMFMFEAFFCCTMRLGEGMRVLSDNFIDDTLFYPESGNYGDVNISIDLYSGKPITIKSLVDKTIKIYVPKGIEIENNSIRMNNCILEVSLKANEAVIIKYKLNQYIENNLHYCGDMIYTKKKINDSCYSPLLDSSLYEENNLLEMEQYFYDESSK